MKENEIYNVRVEKVFKTYCYVKHTSRSKKSHPCKPSIRGGFLHKRGLGLYLSYINDKFIYIEDLRDLIKEGQMIPVKVVLRRTGEFLNKENRYIFKADTSNIDEIFYLWYLEQKNKYLKQMKVNEEKEREEFINGIDI